MKKVLLLILCFSALLFELSSFPRKSIVERYTNSSCGPCAYYNNLWYNSTTSSLIGSGSITHVVYNVNWPSATDPMYLLNPTENNTRWSYYGVNAVPWININGIKGDMSSSADLLNKVNTGNAQASPFKIIMEAETFPSCDDLVLINVKIIRDPDDTTQFLQTTRMRIAITERVVDFGYPLGNGESKFYSIERKMIPDALGQKLKIPAKGDSVLYSYTFKPSTAFLAAVKMDSLRIACFIQNDVTKDVYQSEMVDIKTCSHAVTQTPVVNAGDVEINTQGDICFAKISNWSTNTLVISNIPSSVGPFQCLNNSSVSVAPNDTLVLQFRLNPTTTGSFQSFYNITSNDAVFKGFTLIGRGYKSEPADLSKLYASSGTGNNAKLLNLNFSTGAGTNIGETKYPSVKSICVNPKDNIIFGIYAGDESSEILRINALTGEAFNFTTASLLDLSGIAFDTSGQLYASQKNGLIYKINMQTKTFTRICSLAVKPYSIAFNPITNEMWASTYAVIGAFKDKIIKINYSVGTYIEVGNTGFGILTNGITFDAQGDLFGITGSETQISNFVSINKITGMGTIIGSTGLTNITSIAFGSNKVLDINDEKTELDYSLKQNYPNPFNPSTRIRYSIKDRGYVSLKIYDILGNLVRTLISEIKESGNYDIAFDASGLSSGIYFYKLNAGGVVLSKKMCFIK